MAADEDQPQAVIADHVLLWHVVGLQQERQLGVERLRAGDDVERAAAGDRREPRAGVGRHALARPVLERLHVRVLHRLLRDVEVPRDAHRRGEHVGPLVTMRVLDGVQRTWKSISGTTSTPPSTTGVSLAIASAVSRSRASITNTPPSTSFVSRNGPSVSSPLRIVVAV